MCIRDSEKVNSFMQKSVVVFTFHRFDPCLLLTFERSYGIIHIVEISLSLLYA
jgi:hypothetical protein